MKVKDVDLSDFSNLTSNSPFNYNADISIDTGDRFRDTNYLLGTTSTADEGKQIIGATKPTLYQVRIFSPIGLPERILTFTWSDHDNKKN